MTNNPYFRSAIILVYGIISMIGGYLGASIGHWAVAVIVGLFVGIFSVLIADVLWREK